MAIVIDMNGSFRLSDVRYALACRDLQLGVLNFVPGSAFNVSRTKTKLKVQSSKYKVLSSTLRQAKAYRTSPLFLHYQT